MKPRVVRRLYYRGYSSHDHIDVEDGDDRTGVLVAEAFTSGNCPNCGSPFTGYRHTASETRHRDDLWTYVPVSELYFCHTCGWWQVRQEGMTYPPKNEVNFTPTISRYAFQYHSILEQVDIASNDIICADLREHLKRKWKDRKFISASKAEELVQAILSEHLRCDVHHATANVNAPDGGIDLFVCSENGEIKAAVQVKRRISHEVERVEAVRNFVGALVVEGHRKGIFVTTASRFSRGAKRIAASPRLKSYKLELDLIDGEALLELLSVTAPKSEISLPEIIRPSTEWSAPDGGTITTEDLLMTCIGP